MTRMRGNERDVLLQHIVAGDESGDPARQREVLHMLRRHFEAVGGDGDGEGDAALREENDRLRRAFRLLELNHHQLQAKLEELLAPPWFPAVYLGSSSTADRSGAVVHDGSGARLVGLAEGIAFDDLVVGDQVFLSEDRNLLIAKCPLDLNDCGETAEYQRPASPERLVLKSRDEEVVVRASAALLAETLNAGDLIRWDRRPWMAFEKIGRSSGAESFLEETPTETFADIGGLDDQIAVLQRAIRLHREGSDVARKYELSRLGGLVMGGRPGNGKTMLARALANWLATLSPSGKARFMNIKPASLHSMWYGQSEERYREAFAVARRFGDQDPSVPVVMFFDEIDACGMARGASLGHVDDRVLSAFLAELDGLSRRGNILVVGATNRLDSLDPALLRAGRLGDCVLNIPRPGRQAAREILNRHLSATVPFARPSRDGSVIVAGSDRETVLEAAIARLYAENETNQVAVLHFRNGESRPVHARDLVSGSGLAKIVRVATERACLREMEGGAAGLRHEDFWAAIDDEMEQAARVLTVRNCRSYLDDLPQDVDVVRVECVKRPTARMYRILRVA